MPGWEWTKLPPDSFEDPKEFVTRVEQANALLDLEERIRHLEHENALKSQAIEQQAKTYHQELAEREALHKQEIEERKSKERRLQERHQADIDALRERMAAQREARRYAFYLYGVVVLFTIVSYFLQGFGLIDLSEELLVGLASMTIGEAFTLPGVVYWFLFKQQTVKGELVTEPTATLSHETNGTAGDGDGAGSHALPHKKEVSGQEPIDDGGTEGVSQFSESRFIE